MSPRPVRYAPILSARPPTPCPLCAYALPARLLCYTPTRPSRGTERGHVAVAGLALVTKSLAHYWNHPCAPHVLPRTLSATLSTRYPTLSRTLSGASRHVTGRVQVGGDPGVH
eukprot:3472243-Rhodomonas_salina.1